MKKFLAFLVVVGLLAVYVWPTRYKHYAPGENPHASQELVNDSTRVDRLTGDIEVQERSGEWRKVGNTRKSIVFERPDVNPNAVHRSVSPTDRSTSNQQQRSYDKTQKDIQGATEKPRR